MIFSPLNCPLEPPFSPCEQNSIFVLIDQNLTQFDRPAKSIAQTLGHIEMKSTLNPGGMPGIYMDGMEQLEHMSIIGIRQKRGEPGVYCVVLTARGEVKSRRYLDSRDQQAMLSLTFFLKDMGVGEWLFLVHKGDVVDSINKATLYLLQQMGCNVYFDGLAWDNFLFVARKDALPLLL